MAYMYVMCGLFACMKCTYPYKTDKNIIIRIGKNDKVKCEVAILAT